MTCYYDPERDRLIYVQREATPDFWDERWLAEGGLQRSLTDPRPTYVSRLNRRFVDPGAGPVLEGGCGTGRHVAAMVRDGYSCIGIDSAPRTVAAVREAAPDLDIRLGDVRALDLADASMAAYWSLGVIEHFPEGYETIGREMARVLQPGGVLLLVFPYLSPLRRRRVRQGAYAVWAEPDPPAGFYQFALDHAQVTRDFHGWGFDLADQLPLDGLYGFLEENARLGPTLRKLYDYQGSNRLLRGTRHLANRALTRNCGHSVLLVLRRR